MRSEHNHKIDENSYESFLASAIKVRKFTRKSTTMDEIGADDDIGHFALAMIRLKSKVFDESEEEIEEEDDEEVGADENDE